MGLGKVIAAAAIITASYLPLSSYASETPKVEMLPPSMTEERPPITLPSFRGDYTICPGEQNYEYFYKALYTKPSLAEMVAERVKERACLLAESHHHQGPSLMELISAILEPEKRE